MSPLFCVEIFDDELVPKRWRAVVFSCDEIVDEESRRALMGVPQSQPVVRRHTSSREEAQAKLRQMENEGWKARIKQIDSEEVLQ